MKSARCAVSEPEVAYNDDGFRPRITPGETLAARKRKPAQAYEPSWFGVESSGLVTAMIDIGTMLGYADAFLV